MLRHLCSPLRSPGLPARSRTFWLRGFLALVVLGSSSLLTNPRIAMSQNAAERPRARDIGLEIGIFPTGPHNAITDVGGVTVGQVTVWEGEDVRTGVTAVRQHPGNVFREKVPGAVVVGNGFGKLVGVTQIRELGEMETPILLTCTLCVWKAADAMVEWLLEGEGMEGVGSINPVVGETNDGGLNDIRSRPIRPEHVRRALESASGGPVEEGTVGAGTGTRAFGWKGGIGTSSRVLPEELGGYTVGVLVQSNFGGILTMGGAPVGRELGRFAYQRYLEGEGSRDPNPTGAGESGSTERSGGDGSGGVHRETSGPDRDGSDPDRDSSDPDREMSDTGREVSDPDREMSDTGRKVSDTDDGVTGRDEGGSFDLEGRGIPDAEGGSIMMVVATDAPLTSRNLERVARRALLGLARTGSSGSNGSGDYVLAFSTAEEVRRGPSRDPRRILDLPNDGMSPLFQATIEATEEAIYNSLLKATSVTGRNGRTAEALPIEETMEILRKYGAIR